MAIEKPTSKPNWATNDENDPLTGAPNKVDPSAEFKLSGLKRNQPLPRSFLNFQFNLIRRWFDWVEDQINTLVSDGASTTLQAVYPVGAYYMSSVSTNPNTLFGFGTWVRVKGKFLVGLDEADTDFDGAGETGGSKTHTHSDNFSVSNHTLTINEIPSHGHNYIDRYYAENSSVLSSASNKETMPTNYNGKLGSGDTEADNNTFLTYSSTTSTAGGGQAHNHNLSGGVQSASNLPPYEACYIYKRTA